MSLFDTEYSSNGGATSGSSSGGDYKDRDSLKLGNYSFVSGVVDRIGYSDKGWGLSAIVDLDDVQVIDGIVMDRFYAKEGSGRDPEDDDTMKVFGWDAWFLTDENGKLTEDVSADDVPARHSEDIGGDTYPYKLEGAVQEGQDPYELGDMSLWLNNGTKARTILKVLTPYGHGIIDDKDSEGSWFHTNMVELRDDLEDERIILSYYVDSFTPDDQDEPVTYTDAKILDAATGAGITMLNGGGEPSDMATTTGGEVSGPTGNNASELPEGVPAGADKIIDFMANTGTTEPSDVKEFVEGEVGDADYDLDAVVAEIESRMD